MSYKTVNGKLVNTSKKKKWYERSNKDYIGLDHPSHDEHWHRESRESFRRFKKTK
jgi:hypothetical protein